MARKLSAVFAAPVNLSLPLLPRPQIGDLGSLDTLGG
jgi:hypothetical protein